MERQRVRRRAVGQTPAPASTRPCVHRQERQWELLRLGATCPRAFVARLCESIQPVMSVSVTPLSAAQPVINFIDTMDADVMPVYSCLRLLQVAMELPRGAGR
jgi:hypothetical protein